MSTPSCMDWCPVNGSARRPKPEDTQPPSTGQPEGVTAALSLRSSSRFSSAARRSCWRSRSPARRSSEAVRFGEPEATPLFSGPPMAGSAEKLNSRGSSPAMRVRRLPRAFNRSTWACIWPIRWASALRCVTASRRASLMAVRWAASSRFWVVICATSSVCSAKNSCSLKLTTPISTGRNTNNTSASRVV